jgi:hypothetical protein
MKKYMVITMACITLVTSSYELSAAAEPPISKSKLEQQFYAECHKNICGICQEPKAEFLWSNPHSRYAHIACYNLILPALSDAYAKLNKTFSINPENNEAHQTFITFLQEKIGCQTIKAFATKEGGVKTLEKMCNETIDEAIQHIRDNKYP